MRACEAKALALDVALLMAAVGFGAAMTLLVEHAVLVRPEPSAATAQAEVVRVLDIVVRDSNTSNRRQRFECRPVEKGAKR